MTKSPQAYFEMPSTGIRITNVLSYDTNDELVLTFSFANGIPGYSGAVDSVKELNGVVGRGVEITIARIRQMVEDGSL